MLVFHPKPRLIQCHSTLTCILCAGKATIARISQELGIQSSLVGANIVQLRYQFMLVRRDSVLPDTQEVFELTSTGKQYAIDQRIQAIDQGDQLIQQSAFDAERQALKEQNDMLFQQKNQAETRLAELQRQLDETIVVLGAYRKQGAAEGAFRKAAESPFVAARRFALAEARKKLAYGGKHPAIDQAFLDAAKKEVPPAEK